MRRCLLGGSPFERRHASIWPETPMKFATLTLACSAALYAFPAVAHHSFAMFDANKTVTLQGTVKAFEWTNPHSWILVNVPNAQGRPEEWTIEAGAPAGLVRQ